jgi:hypothetical protein
VKVTSLISCIFSRWKEEEDGNILIKYAQTSLIAATFYSENIQHNRPLPSPCEILLSLLSINFPQNISPIEDPFHFLIWKGTTYKFNISSKINHIMLLANWESVYIF